MSTLKCPKCGSSDCKERSITFEKVMYDVLDIGGAILVGIFKGRSTSESMTMGNLNRISRGQGNTHEYRCRHCGYEWKK